MTVKPIGEAHEVSLHSANGEDATRHGNERQILLTRVRYFRRAAPIAAPLKVAVGYFSNLTSSSVVSPRRMETFWVAVL